MASLNRLSFFFLVTVNLLENVVFYGFADRLVCGIEPVQAHFSQLNQLVFIDVRPFALGETVEEYRSILRAVRHDPAISAGSGRTARRIERYSSTVSPRAN